MFPRTLLAVSLALAVFLFGIPARVMANSIDSGTALRGRITAIHGKYDLTVRDARGLDHSVRMHQGTIIRPTDTTLQSGMDVTIEGTTRGVVFEADQIDTPYLIAPGYAYPIRPPFLFFGRYRYDNRHWYR